MGAIGANGANGISKIGAMGAMGAIGGIICSLDCGRDMILVADGGLILIGVIGRGADGGLIVIVGVICCIKFWIGLMI